MAKRTKPTKKEGNTPNVEAKESKKKKGNYIKVGGGTLSYKGKLYKTGESVPIEGKVPNAFKDLIVKA